MAGITTSAFRRSVRRWGAGLVFTEMIAAAGICYGNRRTLAYLQHRRDEHPLGFQLLGSDPTLLQNAADACLQAGADLLDQPACPVRKVMKTGAERRCWATGLASTRFVRWSAWPARPVTVKLRAGRQGERQDGACGAAGGGRRGGSLPAPAHGAAAHVCCRSPLPGAVRAPAGPRVSPPETLPTASRGGALRAAPPGSYGARRQASRGSSRSFWASRTLRRAGGGAASLRERGRLDMGERAVGYLRQFWPRFRRSGALDRRTAEKR